MARPGSGDGFITLADGGVRWGRYGAAGVLVRHVDPEERVWLFLARRSAFCHRGGTWAIPGGAIDAGELPVDAALREFAEEIGELPGPYAISAVHEDDHGGWSYWTIVVDVPERFLPPPILSWETDDARWVPAEEVGGLPLFDAFAATLQRLRIAAL